MSAISGMFVGMFPSIRRWTFWLCLPLGALLAAQLLTGTGCANISPPLGGPKDTLPPVLVAARPLDSTTRFNTKKITLVFNEYVKLENITENLIISPTPKGNPEVVVKLKTVNITLKDTLLPNTTYTLHFGKSILDVNEGNVLKDFAYLFSTGDQLDDGQLAGNVILAETGKSDSTLLAVLYRNPDDSAVTKERPRYITRLNNKGQFLFRNLPREKFYLYAFKDEGGARRYISKSQLFAFADQPVVISDTPAPITLFAFSEKEAGKKEPAGATARNPVAREKKEGDRRLRIENNLDRGEMDLLKPLELYFKSDPLKNWDSTKAVFTDENFQPLSNFQWKRDTGNTKVSLSYPWVENTGYHLILNTGVATDTAGRTLTETDTLSFRTRKSSYYGLLRLRLLNLDLSRKPVLQFVQNNTVTYAFPLSSRDFFAKLFPPGEYELRILFDENGNGSWDTGSFFEKKRQPERVQPIDRKLNVKANWDNEVDIRIHVSE